MTVEEHVANRQRRTPMTDPDDGLKKLMDEGLRQRGHIG